jgi:hypothetical protein
MIYERGKMNISFIVQRILVFEESGCEICKCCKCTRILGLSAVVGCLDRMSINCLHECKDLLQPTFGRPTSFEAMVEVANYVVYCYSHDVVHST